MPWISLVNFHQVTPQPSISMFVISLCNTNRVHWGTDTQMRVTWLFPVLHGGKRAKKHPKNPPQEKKKGPGNKRKAWLHVVQQTAKPARHKCRFVFPGGRRLKCLHWFTLKYLH